MKIGSSALSVQWLWWWCRCECYERASAEDRIQKGLKFLAQAIEHCELSVTGMHPEMAKPTYQLARIS